MADGPPARGWIDPKFPNPMGPDDAAIIIYGYTPSIIVGVLGAALFFIASIFHSWQLLKYPTWYFCTMLIGTAFVRSLRSNHGQFDLIVQCSGRKDLTTPNNILLAGLASQAFSFLVFMWRAQGLLFKVASKGFYAAFSVSVILIYLRVCFRLAETAQRLNGELSTHEVYFGCLEFALVVIAIFLLAIGHPGRCIPGPRSVHADSDFEVEKIP